MPFHEMTDYPCTVFHDDRWQRATILGFPLEFLAVALDDGTELTLDLAPDSDDWGRVAPPF